MIPAPQLQWPGSTGHLWLVFSLGSVSPPACCLPPLLYMPVGNKTRQIYYIANTQNILIVPIRPLNNVYYTTPET